MKNKNYILLYLVLLFISTQVFCQNSEVYRVKLRKDNHKELILYDTIVSFDYLIQESKRNNGICNFEFFRGFNYVELDFKNTNENELIMFNDTVEIKILSQEFDTLRILENLTSDSNYYINHPFYGLDELSITDLGLLTRPHNELDKIYIRINNTKIELPEENYENFFDVNIICSNNYCPTKAYLTKKGNLIVQMENGGGSSFYYAIFVFNNKGKLIDRVVKSIL